MAAISVVLPVYNGEKYIQESVESILNQTFSDFDLYILDDGSTDSTVTILDTFKDRRIKVIQNGKNEGLIYTLNKGLDLSCNSKYVARMDADDISLPNRLQTQYEFLENNKKVGLLGSAMQQFGEGIKDKSIYRPQLASRINSTFLFYNPIFHPTVMLRTEKLSRRYSYEFPKYEDYHLWISMCQEIQSYNLNQILLKYRRHNDNVTSTYYDNMLLDHSYIKKLLELFSNITDIKLSEEEKNVLSIISTRVRYKLDETFEYNYLQFIGLSILNKLNHSFDSKFFHYLFQERVFLYFLSLKRYNDAYYALVDMKYSNKKTLFYSYFKGKRY